jgi:hypothetical protein
MTKWNAGITGHEIRLSCAIMGAMVKKAQVISPFEKGGIRGILKSLSNLPLLKGEAN